MNNPVPRCTCLSEPTGPTPGGPTGPILGGPTGPTSGERTGPTPGGPTSPTPGWAYWMGLLVPITPLSFVHELS